MSVVSIDTGSKKSTRDPSKNLYAGTQYEDMWNSNPYANNTREDSVWDKIGNFFGIRTGADKWQDELDVRSREFDAQLASLAREDEYNSEAAKVARMRAAGLNPDLQGIESASQAAEFNEPETSPESSAEVDSLGSALGSIISLGTGFTQGLHTIANLFLSLERESLINEGLATDNASATFDLLNNVGGYFDTPDLGTGEVTEGEEGVEGTALSASRKESGRIEQIANSLYGKNPRRVSERRAKANFISSMKSRNGTLSQLSEHLTKEAEAAVAQGDVNVARANLKGRKSVSNAADIEDLLLRSTMLDLEHQIYVDEINKKFLSDEDNQNLVLQGMENEVLVDAMTDPMLAAKANNAGFQAGISDAGASMAEDKARLKQAAYDEEDARYQAEQLKLIQEYYREHGYKKGKPTRKYMRQMRSKYGLGPVNEPSASIITSASGSGNMSRSARSSQSIVRRVK